MSTKSIATEEFFEHSSIEEQKITIDDYFEVAKTIIDFLGSLGKAIYFVQKDLEGNIKKIEDIRKVIPNEELLLELIQQECKDKPSKGTDALLWLNRGIDFCHHFLTLFLYELAMGEDKVKAQMQMAYKATLEQHHGMFAKGAFRTAMSFVPNRETIMIALFGSSELPPTDAQAKVEATLKQMGEAIELIKKSLSKYQ